MIFFNVCASSLSMTQLTLIFRILLHGVVGVFLFSTFFSTFGVRCAGATLNAEQLNGFTIASEPNDGNALNTLDNSFTVTVIPDRTDSPHLRLGHNGQSKDYRPTINHQVIQSSYSEDNVFSSQYTDMHSMHTPYLDNFSDSLSNGLDSLDFNTISAQRDCTGTRMPHFLCLSREDEFLQTSDSHVTFEKSLVQRIDKETSQHIYHSINTLKYAQTLENQMTSYHRQPDILSTTPNVFSAALSISPTQNLDSWTSSPGNSISSSIIQGNVNHKGLIVNTLRYDSGFIASPKFDGKAEYPNFENDTYCFPANAADDQMLLLTFIHFNLERSSSCRFDSLSIYERRDTYSMQKVWKNCGNADMDTLIFNTSSVCLNFVSDSSVAKSGFKAIYSLFPRSSQFLKLHSGLFDCSLIDSYHRSLHFDCNLVVECEDRRDELNCSYSNQECPGLVSAGNKCLTIIRRHNVTWYDAENECISLNQTLASPKNRQEWETFISLVSNRNLIFLGLRQFRQSNYLPFFYDELWKWSTDTTAFNMYIKFRFYRSLSSSLCAMYTPTESNNTIAQEECSRSHDALIICQEGKSPPTQQLPLGLPNLQLQNSSFKLPIQTQNCSLGHITHDFLVCDVESNCFDYLFQEECLQMQVGPTPELFQCFHSGTQYVHYTLLCDFKPDCSDFSDESFCIYDSCQEQTCRSGQCVRHNQYCDGIPDCLDGSDENCAPSPIVYPMYVSPPVIVDIKGRKILSLRPLNDSDTCPDTHFQCKDLNCLPAYLRCNRVNDCTDHDDEDPIACATSTCPGYYRCRGSPVCLHPSQVCDGQPHCPQHDDEILCGMKCPEKCHCQGLAFICVGAFSVNFTSSLRYLDVSGVNMTSKDLTRYTYLVFLRLSKCYLKTLSQMSLQGLRNLHKLDLTDNSLKTVSMSIFYDFSNLKTLVLARNPLNQIISTSRMQLSLTKLVLSNTILNTISNETFVNVPSLVFLNLSHSGIYTITSNCFSHNIRYLDLRGNELTSYPKFMLRSLVKLKRVWSDKFQLCCSGALPEGFSVRDCEAPQGKFSSCDDLLRSDIYKGFIWIIAFAALVGNAGSIVARFYIADESNQSSFNVFVTNLSLADLLMGVYLIIIGIADQLFQEVYWLKAQNWKSGDACKTAGCLALLSSEVSAFFICLITVDRFLVLRFPFSRIRFGRRSALVASLMAWAAGLVLAVVPVLPMTSHWNFYGQTDICLPLPFTTGDGFSGYIYSFSVMVVLNSILFLVIAVGQVFIYCSVRTKSVSHIRKKAKSRDAVVARRLLSIVLSDFLCWFPVSVLGIMASTGMSISLDVNVVVAIFLVPLNAALNPFLYTMNMIMERRRMAAETRILKRLQFQLQTTIVGPGPPLETQLKDTTIE